MNLQIFKILLFVASSIILLSTAYAQITGKTKTDTAKASSASTSANNLKPQTTCPVMGGEIDVRLYVDYDGMRIYVGCTDCVEQVANDPEKYIRKLESMGQGVEIIDDGTKKADSVPASRTPMNNMNLKDTGTTDNMAAAKHPAKVKK